MSPRAAVPDDVITAAAFAAKAGDRDAAARFVELTRAHVARFLAHLADPGDVEDLTQETYLRALPALRRFAGTSTARTWLLAVARNVAADHVRAAVRRPRPASLDARDPEAAPPARLRQVGVDEGVALRALLDGLAPERREAFVVTQVLGFSYAEAAEVCDCPIGTIRSRVARAREDLVAAYVPAEPVRRSTAR
jgi:RNA polymerase sigma-70 factor (ECF subfamily)